MEYCKGKGLSIEGHESVPHFSTSELALKPFTTSRQKKRFLYEKKRKKFMPQPKINRASCAPLNPRTVFLYIVFITLQINENLFEPVLDHPVRKSCEAN